jgi:hypothetical protein
MIAGSQPKNCKYLLKFEKPLDTNEWAWEKPIPKQIKGKKSYWIVPLRRLLQISMIGYDRIIVSLFERLHNCVIMAEMSFFDIQ